MYNCQIFRDLIKTLSLFHFRDDGASHLVMALQIFVMNFLN